MNQRIDARIWGQHDDQAGFEGFGLRQCLNHLPLQPDLLRELDYRLLNLLQKNFIRPLRRQHQSPGGRRGGGRWRRPPGLCGGKSGRELSFCLTLSSLGGAACREDQAHAGQKGKDNPTSQVFPPGVNRLRKDHAWPKLIGVFGSVPLAPGPTSAVHTWAGEQTGGEEAEKGAKQGREQIQAPKAKDMEIEPFAYIVSAEEGDPGSRKKEANPSYSAAPEEVEEKPDSARDDEGQ
ncbi:MAG: hypothetical protein GTO63_03165 [Anaerolineae bacterium]|nr:hypothetical protein [Anaerolineae bacterium]NIN94015.1 hypothetical protein [Anaerolineae bacterium]